MNNNKQHWIYSFDNDKNISFAIALAVSVATGVTVIMFALHQWTVSTGGVI
jgi:hypothetical protein